MDILIELAVAIMSGVLGVVLFRFLKPKSNTEAVIVKVEDKAKENEKLAQEISKILEDATKTNKEIEAEKNKEVTNKEVDDFFNNRKH